MLLAERQAKLAARRSRQPLRAGAGAGARTGQPQAPANVFEALWRAAPVKAGTKPGEVVVDVSALASEGLTTLHAVRYAWPLGDDGDTCCPDEKVSQGLSGSDLCWLPL